MMCASVCNRQKLLLQCHHVHPNKESIHRWPSARWLFPLSGIVDAPLLVIVVVIAEYILVVRRQRGAILPTWYTRD